MTDAADPVDTGKPAKPRRNAKAARPRAKPARPHAATRAAAGTPEAAAAEAPRRPASPARVKTRHLGLAVAFVILVLVPVGLTGTYLYTRAADQYASTMGFTVRSEEVGSALDLLGGLGKAIGGGGSGHDSDILYAFIRSQDLVADIDSQLDLRAMFSRHADRDPLLSFDTDGTIEDLTDYWQRMVRVSYDPGSGLISLRVLAFDPGDATQIAEAVYAESSIMINALSAIARQDATRYAQEDLDLSLERLKSAREALTAFRLANQIVDPNADIQAQMGLMTTLQQQQAAALIEYDLISESARADDPRVEQARRRLDVIEARVAEERRKFGVGGGGPGGQDYATTIAEFERLTVDREFAETAYAAALSALDGARAEATRQSRYLATFITPTVAEKSEFPRRGLLTGLVALFSLLIWAILSLVYYALRDRS